MCHTKKFIYVKTKKTAGTSVEIALSSLLNPETPDMNSKDIATPLPRQDEIIRKNLGFPGPLNTQKYGRRFFQSKFDTESLRPHSTLDRLLRSDGMNPESFRDYLVIASVRNPFERMVSAYFYEMRRRPLPNFDQIFYPSFYEKLGGAAKDLLGMYRKSFSDFVATQQSEIYTQVESPLLQLPIYWVRWESISEDMEALSERLESPINLGELIKSIHAKDGFRPKNASAAELFASNPDAIRIIELHFQRELTEFGYKYPWS